MKIERAEERIAALDLDLENPRFPVDQQPNTQQDALAVIIRRSSSQFLALCRSIATDGFSSVDPMIGVRDGKRVRILEGNRRLASLQALESPERVSSLLSPQDFAQFKQLAETYAEVAPGKVLIHLFPDEHSAGPTILRRHAGENGGVGIVGWKSPEIDRFKVRFGATPSLATQVLDFLRAHGGETDIPDGIGVRGITTTLDRLFKNPDVRDRLLLSKVDGVLYSQLPAESLLPILQDIVDDFRLGRLTVANIMAVEQRQDYAKRLKQPSAPKGFVVGNPVPLAEVKAIGVASAQRSPLSVRSAARTPKATRPRPTLVPRGTQLNITKPRIRDLFVELRDTQMRNAANLTAVGFRVFLELSVVEYMKRHRIPQPEREELSKKLMKVADHMVDAGTLDRLDRKVVKKAADDKTGNYAYSAYSLNQLAHNGSWHPDIDALQRAWEELDPFLRALWP